LESKIATYLGFAIKSNKIIYGYDSLKEYNKKLYLIIVCNTANDKYVEFAKSKKTQTNCDVYKVERGTLDVLMHRVNCKIIGIKSKDLATAIIKNKSDILVEVI
jgi:hypothetical protein